MLILAGVIVIGAAVNAYQDGPYVPPPPAPEPDDPSGERWVRCEDGSFIKVSDIRE